MSVLRRLAPESRSWNPSWQYLDGTIPPPGWSGAVSTAGASVTETTSMQLIDAYACVSLLEDSVSQLPLQTFRRNDESRKPIAPSPLLVAPDPEIELWEWVARIVGSMATSGNAYGYLHDPDRRGYPQQCSLLPSASVRPYRDRDDVLKYDVQDSQYGRGTIDAPDMLHIPLTVLPGSIKGLSPVEQSKRGIGLAIATEEFGAQWFGDGAAPSSVLESEDVVTDEQARTTTARWVASHGGSRRPAFLGGGLKWKAVQIAPNESQFLETRKLNTEQIARIWRVPPHMIGSISDTASQGGGQGISAQRMGFVVHTLGPYLTRIERALSSKWVSPPDEYAKFNVSALLRGDTIERYQSYAIARQWGWMCVDDIRALEDMPPLPNDEGKVFLQPLNMESTAGADEMSTAELTLALQKIYLAVGVLISPDEAREILNRGGAGLTGTFQHPGGAA